MRYSGTDPHGLVPLGGRFRDPPLEPVPEEGTDLGERSSDVRPACRLNNHRSVWPPSIMFMTAATVLPS